MKRQERTTKPPSESTNQPQTIVPQAIACIHTPEADAALTGESQAHPICIESDSEVLDAQGGSLTNTAPGESQTGPICIESASSEPAPSGTQAICKGVCVPLMPGATPYAAYPFMLHEQLLLPWDVHLTKDRLMIQSTSCEGTVDEDSDDRGCRICRTLPTHGVMEGIRQRMEHGVHENSPYVYQSMQGLINLMRKKTNTIDAMRYEKLTRAAKLLTRVGALDEHKRFIMAVGDGRVDRVDALIQAASKQKLGIRGMLHLLDRAMKGAYRPKNYTEEEKLRGILFLRLGGARVAELAHRSLGAPGVSTLRRYSSFTPFRPSASFPSTEDIGHNITASFALNLNEMDTLENIGYVLMIDEIKTESRLRWDDKTNKILGLCREHSQNLGVDFCSIDDVRALLDALDSKEVHFASEATVAAIGLLSVNPRTAGPSRPILISGTCKREKADRHAYLIEQIIQACAAKIEYIRGPLLCIASDGESRRGSALIRLTQKAVLHPSSRIYPLLYNLRLLNLLVGENDITADKDYKHVIKRLRNFLLRKKGTMVHGIHITPDLLRWHLKAAGVSSHRIESLFNPNDRQDVALAYTFLKEIWSLQAPTPTDKPTFVTARNAIRSLGQLFRHILLPYIQITLSLHEQLVHLSAAAHLACFLFTTHNARSSCMPSQTYYDIILLVKNAYFCVAKIKVHHPDAPFWLILLGTDRLEQSFGILRSMVGNDVNVDIYQLVNCLSNVSECAEILTQYPHWDRSPRPAVDHITPALWKGDVCVSNVQLVTCWNLGRQQAELDLSETDIRDTLASMDASEGVDMAFPFGGAFEVWCEDDDEDRMILLFKRIIINVSSGCSMDLGGLDLEDQLALEETQCGGLIKPTLEIDGKPVYKARILRELFKFKTARGSTDRLKRVAGLAKFSEPLAETSYVDAGHDHDAEMRPVLSINDPAATLVQCQDKIFLAVVNVTQITIDKRPVYEIGLELLMEPIVKVHFQILHLSEVPCEAQFNADWAWTQNMVTTAYHSQGAFIQALSPLVSTEIAGRPTYLFQSRELQAVAALLFGQLANNQQNRLPLVRSSTFSLIGHKVGLLGL
ncbi:hypothetical protein BD779DRAFT_1702573 [Infundibulicybe gibba]|nr:hypothetical protein BD779DRAFT_1702573 [Infundibulicybe gibba]